MTEPTLAQWKERALVAEALLEERTQELEGLRAELDDLRSKNPTTSKAPQIGIYEVWDPNKRVTPDVAKMQRFADLYGSGKKVMGFDVGSDEFAQFISGEQWTQEELERIMRYLMEPPPPMRVAEPDKPKGISPYPPEDPYKRKKDRYKRAWDDMTEQYKPDVGVSHVRAAWTETGLYGNVAEFNWIWQGKEWRCQVEASSLARALDKYKYGALTAARELAADAAQRWGMPQRDEDALASMLADAINSLGRP